MRICYWGLKCFWNVSHRREGCRISCGAGLGTETLVRSELGSERRGESERRSIMLKFLTHKLRTHSLNEESVSEKVGVGASEHCEGHSATRKWPPQNKGADRRAPTPSAGPRSGWPRAPGRAGLSWLLVVAGGGARLRHRVGRRGRARRARWVPHSLRHIITLLTLTPATPLTLAGRRSSHILSTQQPLVSITPSASRCRLTRYSRIIENRFCNPSRTGICIW